ncbi:MAG: undecaprenyl-diphosphate phosphatase [Saprospiraceae bacterium]|nr:undecaprenyl-diphosphate phosphatase [Saprospiraceae bacterium]MCB9324789.1 undecaprenyl-diphosphate phosphatase [Lewinellaceae bacterium]
MNDLIEAIILGIIQGLTEFLPVSSSGHLELAKYLLKDDNAASMSMLMTVTLHGATALSTILVFRKEIMEILRGLFQFSWNEELKYSLKIILSMIPAACIGLFFEAEIEQFFTRRIGLVGAMLIFTGGLLFFADRAKRTGHKVSYLNAFIIGIAQAIAIIPGISRSGATISTSVLLGVDRERAARFSFLMVVPLILGKMGKDLLDGAFTTNGDDALALGIGFVAAFLTGTLACLWMLKVVKNSKLSYFAIYCLVVGSIALAAAFGVF